MPASCPAAAGCCSRVAGWSRSTVTPARRRSACSASRASPRPVERAQRVARPYRRLSDVPVVPAFEIIATVAQRSAGRRRRLLGRVAVRVAAALGRGGRPARDARRPRPAARPGRPAGPGAAATRTLLRLPYVGLAVDPEWKLRAGSGRCGQIGSIDATEINRTSAWLAALVRAEGLPQKLFVVHQFRLSMIGREQLLRTDRPELAVLVHMDGQGGSAQKEATWDAVRRARPDGPGSAGRTSTTRTTRRTRLEETMRRHPAPVMISYQ